MEHNLADDIAAQLDLADAARAHALKRPQAFSQRQAALGIPVSSVLVVNFDFEIWDTNGMIDIAGQPSRITAVAGAGAGLYLVNMILYTDTTAWTKADILLSKNGTMMTQRTFHTPQSFSYLYHSQIVYMGTVSDFLTMSVYHEGGGTTNTAEVDFQAWKIADN
jgi:hypothetical protein